MAETTEAAAGRRIVLDTETTGLETRDGHRIIEIGCIELQARRATGNNLQHYLQPDRLIDEGAIAVHGITNEYLADKPRFADVADSLLEYLSGAELIIHNAAFDLGFLDYEFGLLNRGIPPLAELCTITDTLKMAREKHPGQKNSLDALCKRYEIDNSRRDFHGALLDSQLLADVFLAMTGGQSGLALDADDNDDSQQLAAARLFSGAPQGAPLRIDVPDDARQAHDALVQSLAEKAGDAGPRWH